AAPAVCARASPAPDPPSDRAADTRNRRVSFAEPSPWGFLCAFGGSRVSAPVYPRRTAPACRSAAGHRQCTGRTTESTMDYPLQRRQQLSRTLADEGVDALLVCNPLNVTYLTGFSGEASHLILLAQRAILVSDPRFTAQIAEECPGLETVIR